MCAPEVARVSEGAVTGDALTLPLVEGVQGVRVVAGLPAAGVEVTPLIEALQHVLPLCIRDLSTSRNKNILVTFIMNDCFKFGLRNVVLTFDGPPLGERTN